MSEPSPASVVVAQGPLARIHELRTLLTRAGIACELVGGERRS